MTATAAWDAPTLVDTLARRGWGELDGRPCGGLRAVLRALVALLPYEAAEGRVTAAQVADVAGLSVKWARHCLAELEDRGIITWRRGFLKEGRPRPGWVRISKTRLAEMIRGLKDALDERRARRAAEGRHRLATTLRATTIPPWRKHRPLSSRWELSSTLPTPKGRTARGASDPDPLQAPPLDLGDLVPACTICGKAEDRCRQDDQKVPAALQHAFIPGRARVPALVTPSHELHPSPQPKPLRDWRAIAQTSLPAPTLEGLNP